MKKPIFSKLVGVKFPEIQANITLCTTGDQLTMEREPDNPFDPNAIRVYKSTIPLGYINRDLASQLAPRIDDGVEYVCIIQTVTGGGEKLHGVNIMIDTLEPQEVVTADQPTRDEYELFDMSEILMSIIEDLETHQ